MEFRVLPDAACETGFVFPAHSSRINSKTIPLFRKALMLQVTAGGSGGCFCAHHCKMFASLMSSYCWHLKVAEILILILHHLGNVFPWGIQIWALILPHAAEGVGCLGHACHFPLQFDSFQVSDICVASLNIQTLLFLQSLLNYAWHDLNFWVLKEKPKQPQILSITPPILCNQGVCLTRAHLQPMLWDRKYNPHTSPCSWFSVCIQRNE